MHRLVDLRDREPPARHDHQSVPRTDRGRARADHGRALDELHAQPPGCPTGTTANGNRCRYPDGSNVPMLLGTDMRGDLGAMLASVTPGARAPVSLMLAAGDPMRDGKLMRKKGTSSP